MKAVLGNFACFFGCLLIFFSKSTFRKILSKTPSVPSSLDPHQARRPVGPDLVPNCLQKLSADGTSRQRYNLMYLPK